MVFKKNTNLLIVVFFFLIICLFFGKQIFTKATFGYSHTHIDENHLHVKAPLYIINAQEVRRGNIPLWNPYLCFGVPFLAYTFIGTFYPLYIFYYILSYKNALVFIYIIHMLLGGFLFYLFARKIKISVFSSFISATVFMVCGLNIVLILTHDTGHHSTLAFMPLAFLAVYNIIEKFSLTRAILLILIIGLQASIGDFSYIIIEFVGIVSFLIFLLLRKYKETKRFKEVCFISIAIVAFIILGLLLNGITLLPAKEFVENSIRGGGFSDEYRQRYASNSLTDILFFSLIPVYENQHPEMRGAFTVHNFFYLGIISLALYSLSFFSKNKLKFFFCIVLPIISLFFICGYYTPFFYFINFLPIFRNMHLFIRFCDLLVFTIAVCVGIGLDFLQGQDFAEYRSKKNIFIKICLLGYALIVILYFKDNLGMLLKPDISLFFTTMFFLLFTGILLAYFVRKNASRGLRLPVLWLSLWLIWCGYELWRFSRGAFSYVLLSGQSVFIPKLLLISSLISAGILAVCFKNKISYKPLCFIILSLIILNYYSFYRSGKPIEEEINLENKTYSEFFRHRRNIDRVLILRLVYPYRHSICSDVGILYQTPTLGGEFYLPLKRYAKFMNLLNEDFFKLKNEQINYWDLAFPYETADFINMQNIHLINMANVKYLVAEGFTPKITISDEAFTSPFNLVVDKDIKIYENKDALSRAYIVHKVKVVNDERQVIGELKNPEFNYKDYVIVENGGKELREQMADYRIYN